jgi:hypothetical protein
MRAPLGLVVALASVLAACVPSLHPLYEGPDLVLEPTLPGVWQTEDGSTSWTFTQATGRSYSLVIQEHGVRDRFEAHLVRLGDGLFLDLFPVQEDIDGTYREMPEGDSRDRLYFLHTARVHSFWRVSLEGRTLCIMALDVDWLRKALDEGTVALGHARRGTDDLILTAPTAELQRFVGRYADKGAFSERDPLILVKQAPGAAR